MNKLNHVAFIMDGNGRWATNKGLERTKGHEKGLQVFKDICNYAHEFNIKEITFFAFSTENWKRSEKEVNFLMSLPTKYLKKYFHEFEDKNFKLVLAGERSSLPKNVLKVFSDLEEKTKKNKKLVVNIAFNYGSKQEIIRSVNKVIDQKQEINEKNITNNLDIKNDVDLLIRSAGEERISNFLLWQITYAEIYFTKTLWPDFNKDELVKIINNYKQRKRKFGGY